MSDSTYSVIFRGDLQPGYTVADVKANFARLFRLGPAAVDKLFSGRPLAIKKGLRQAQAEQLVATLAKLGAQSSLKAEAEPAVVARPEPESVLKPESGDRPVAAQPSAESGLSLAPMEGYLLREHERARQEPVQVPVSHLSLKPAEGNLVESSERKQETPPPVAVPDWKLANHITGKAIFKVQD
ncbi:hypothetical protein ACONUD_10285 [Microbulbifer harenosus]|uniref:Uncharacterized protein n=1 Tax=Microbulbifer harenosus TaxID=2576840 RepID=A0ABY2UGM5_9GAMM|nr:hypothetical protein [Microbulbifer harenosus]TLM76714.1 hypothetical protein FDY93_12165 [Microbulbifer harenosus]